MTIGEKIKNARKQCGLSQEQFAEKMGVSRSAVAKWESDKGIPDVDNLRVIAKLLDVSVDYLLDNNEEIDISVIKEPIDLTAYGQGSKKKIKDRIIREKYPNAEIYTLFGELKTKKSEKIIDNLIGFFTDAPFGIPEMINSCKNLDKEFYLVNNGEQQYHVMITNEFIECRHLAVKQLGKKFEIGDWKYTKCGLVK